MISVSFLKPRIWKTIPDQERLGLLFKDLGILTVVSYAYNKIEVEKLDKKIIKERGKEFKLDVMSKNYSVKDPEYKYGKNKVKFVSAHYKDNKIYVKVEVFENERFIMCDDFTVSEIREIIGKQI